MNHMQRYLADEVVEELSGSRLPATSLKLIASVTGSLVVAQSFLAACAPAPASATQPAPTSTSLSPSSTSANVATAAPATTTQPSAVAWLSPQRQPPRVLPRVARSCQMTPPIYGRPGKVLIVQARALMVTWLNPKAQGRLRVCRVVCHETIAG